MEHVRLMENDNLDTFFNPKSVAIIGATKNPDKAGQVIFKNFANNKKRGIFKGKIYPVNPREVQQEWFLKSWKTRWQRGLKLR
jgi:predicted CoA-binding protein